MTTTNLAPTQNAEDVQITPHIIIVDDDEAMRVSLAQWLELSDFAVTVYEDAREALRDINPDFAGVILTDVKMPKLDGITFTRSVLAADPDIPIILMTGHGDVPMAVEAMKSGAYDFVEKPFEPKDIVESLERAIEKRRLVIENRNLRRQIASRGSLDSRLIGNSVPMRNLKDEIAKLITRNHAHAAASLNVVCLAALISNRLRSQKHTAEVNEGTKL